MVAEKLATGYGKVIIPVILILIIVAAVSSFYLLPFGEEGPQSASGTSGVPAQKFKILHIMSYHSPWKWTDDQLDGFKDAMAGIDAEYRVFQMDTKRKSSEEWMQEAARQARELIDTWQPDLVYTNDDNVQDYVVKHYVNSDTPFVFSAVNAVPSVYGFTGSSNVAGILEEEHFVQTVNLLRQIVPNVKKIAVIFDEGLTWIGVRQRMEEKAPKQLQNIVFVSWDTIHTFEEYKQRIGELQNEADAIALLGIFTFKDENGTNVPYQDVLEWTAENSNLPDFSFWEDRISYGTLCAVTVSGYEQGLAAGEIARGILVDGKSPSSFPFEPTVKGEPIISLARANKLGVQISSELLLSAEIIETFEWEK